MNDDSVSEPYGDLSELTPTQTTQTKYDTCTSGGITTDATGEAIGIDSTEQSEEVTEQQKKVTEQAKEVTEQQKKVAEQQKEATDTNKENTTDNHLSRAKVENKTKAQKNECDDEEEEEEDDDEDEGEMEFEPFGDGDDCDDEFSDGWVEDDDENETTALLMKLNFHLSRLMGRDKNPELPASVTRLHLQDDQRNAVIYLIGTAHFSEVSNKEVTDLIQAVRPDRIVLELDHSRSNILFMDEARLISEAQSYNFAMFKKLAAQQGVSYGIMHYLLLRMSASLVEQLGMAPGGEFRAAAKAGSQVPGCTLFYGDRPVGLTLRRAFSQLSFFSRIRLAFALLSSLGPISRDDVERLKQSDLVEGMVKELEAQFPILGRVFVDERDRYLARTIFDFAAMPQSHQHLCLPTQAKEPLVLVAVVGMGHVAGIVRYWDSAETIDRRSLCSIPEPSRAGALIQRGLKWGAIGGLIYGSYCLLTKLALRLF